MRLVCGYLKSTLAGMMCILVLTFGMPLAAQDWTQWGGPNGDFTVEATGLAEKWPEGGPRQLWKRPLGDGFSAILFKGGDLFTMYSTGDYESVISLDAGTGETKWERKFPRTVWQEMDSIRLSYTRGPNATPLIVSDRIITVAIAGQMRCLKLETGKLLWARDLPAEFGRRKRMEEYGYSGSPLLYGESVIVLVGGDNAQVIAVRPEDGSLIWKSKPGAVSYAAPVLTQIAGRDQYIFFELDGVVGMDPGTGRVLWRWKIPFANGNHLTPVVKCDENHIWVSSQFDSGGGRLLRIDKKGNSFKVKELFFKSKLRGSCWTLIRLGEYIFGSAGGHNVSLLTAVHWKTGKIQWQKRGFHMAQCLYADGKLLMLDEDGQLTLAKITPEKLQVLDQAQLMEKVSWTLPTLVSNRLYVRDTKHILALDLSENGK